MSHFFQLAKEERATSGGPSKTEKELMKVCGPKAIQFMRSFFEELPMKATGRAIDVGCGSGRVSKDLLVHLYDAVDAFDLSTESVKEMEQLAK